MRQVRGIIAALLITAPMAATAVPITIDWTSNGGNSFVFSGSGSWTLDDSVIVPGSEVNYAASITAFQFNWNTINGPFFVNSGTGSIAEAFMNFDASLNLTFFSVCAGTPSLCSVNSHPVLQATSINWVGSYAPGQASFVDASQSATVSVPEPGTLALLGIGLAAIGLARRRREA